MMRLRRNNKGQMGVVGEDMLYLVTMVLASVSVILITLKGFTDYSSTLHRVDVYRAALISADIAAAKMAWDHEDRGVKELRVLDLKQIQKYKSSSCKSLCSYCSSVKLFDLKTSKEELICGDATPNTNPRLAFAVIRLPVSVRIDEGGKEPPAFNPGVLQVSYSV